MAGPRHHYIPQCLLRGFAEVSDRGERVLVITRERPPLTCSVKDAAVEKNFYSDALDRDITTLENRMGPAIGRLRAAPAGAVDGRLAEQLIVHLAMRAAHVRVEIEAMFEALLQGIAQRNTDPQFMSGIIGNVDLTQFGGGLLEFMQSHLRDLPEAERTDETKLWAEDRSALIGRLRQEAQSSPASFAVSLDNIIATMTGLIDYMSRDVHLRLVGDVLTGGGAVPALTGFAWSVEAKAADDLILPDCVAAWLGEDGAIAQPYVFPVFESAPIVVLPLAADRFLLGQRGSAWSPSMMDDLPRLLASSARDMFITRPSRPDAAELTPHIGSAPSALQQALAKALTVF